MLGTFLGLLSKITRNPLPSHSFPGTGVSPAKLLARTKEKPVEGSGRSLEALLRFFPPSLLPTRVLLFPCNDDCHRQANYVQVVHVDYLDYD